MHRFQTVLFNAIEFPLPFCAAEGVLPPSLWPSRRVTELVASFPCACALRRCEEGVLGRLGEVRPADETRKWPPPSLVATRTGVCDRALPGGEEVRRAVPKRALPEALPGLDGRSDGRSGRSLLWPSPPTALLGRRPALPDLLRRSEPELARNVAVALLGSCHIRGAWWTNSISLYLPLRAQSCS